MDEEKRKYLEELKKQIDPEILQKMAQHLGGDDAAATNAAMGGGGSAPSSSASASVGSSFASTPADKIRERKASAFQQRVAERKRQDMAPKPKKENEKFGPLLIYSHTEFWSRIAESQFKNLGIQETSSYYEFEKLVRGVLEAIAKGHKQVLVAVSILRIVNFMTSWAKIQEQMKAQDKPELLNNVHFVLAVESMKQVPEEVLPVIGLDRIVDLTEDVQANKEKIRILVGRSEQADQESAE